MEDTTKLRAALVEALRLLDNPPKVKQPETVITHALLSCMESYGPTMEMLERQATELAKANAEVEQLQRALAICADDAYQPCDVARRALESSDD